MSRGDVLSKFLDVRGGRRLKGYVDIAGSKNAAIPCLAASVLTSETVSLSNVPLIDDIECMKQILDGLGAKTSLDSRKRTISIDAGFPSDEIPARLSGAMRGSTLFLGSLLARRGHVKIHGYGGCSIGSRPIDFHLRAFGLLGAKIEERTDFVEISAERLRGTRIHLDFPSVGATENILLAACLAEGMTTVTNVALEPEVVDLVQMLNSMGSQIRIDVDKQSISIAGCNDIGGTTHRIIPDRIEAGTYAVASAITDGRLTLRGIDVTHMDEVLAKLVGMGVPIETAGRERLTVSQIHSPLRSTSITTKPYPGFPTDMQAQFTSLCTESNGTSHIVETVHESRFNHVPELLKMGAKIRVSGREMEIDGPTFLEATEVVAKDLRAGAALVLAALSASGTTRIRGPEHIYRGYERLCEKLAAVGADIEEVVDD